MSSVLVTVLCNQPEAFALDVGDDQSHYLYKLGVISQERLKIEVKLLLSANRKSYMLR